MNEKQTRNGGRGRGRTDKKDDRDEKPASEAQGTGSGRAFVRIALILLAVAAAAGLYRYWGFWETSQEQAQAEAPPPAVTVAKPLIREMEEWSDFTGQFEPMESVEVRARVSGYLESVNFTDGQLVKRGDLLFVIEPRPFELALETRTHRAIAQERIRQQGNL